MSAAQGQTPTQVPGRAESAANLAPYTKSGMFCRHCLTGYRHTDTIGCCSACGRCFKGMVAFDRHQSIQDGRTVCDVTKARKDGKPVFEVTDDGRGPLWRIVPTGTNPWAGEGRVDASIEQLCDGAPLCPAAMEGDR